MFGLSAIRQRLGHLEDTARELRAALELLKATDSARLASTLDAAGKLSAAADRFRKQADRAAKHNEPDGPDGADDPDGTDDDFYERLAAARGVRT